MSRILSLSLTFVAILSGAMALPSAAAASETARCDVMLDGLSDKQIMLEDLQAAVAQGEADRAALAAQIETISASIVQATAAGQPTVALQAKRAELVQQLADQRAIAPAVQAQRDALAADVETEEFAYIACVDASI
jgi:hypothetical protein